MGAGVGLGAALFGMPGGFPGALPGMFPFGTVPPPVRPFAPPGGARPWRTPGGQTWTPATPSGRAPAGTGAAGGGGELHFGAHPLIAFDEIEFVSSAAHIEWMEAAAESDAFLNMVMEGSRRAIEKYGEGSRLRVVDDFVAEIASQPVRKTLFCL